MEPPIENSKREPIKVETGSAHLLLVAWVANFSAYFAIIGITNQLPYLGEKHLGINMAMVGLLALSINVARLGGFFTLRWFSGWNHSPGWLFAAQLAAAGALLTLSQACLLYTSPSPRDS